MANNRGFNRDLKADDVEVGQKLVHVATGRWDNRITNTLNLTVVRKTKTRVILRTDRDVEYRMLVDVNYDNAIRSKYEGQGAWSDPFILYTEDDPGLAEIRLAAEGYKIESKAREACQKFDKERTAENAQAAIGALAKFITAATKEES